MYPASVATAAAGTCSRESRTSGVGSLRADLHPCSRRFSSSPDEASVRSQRIASQAMRAAPRLLLTAAVADRIIGIALEGDARMVPPHPHVERVMEKEIRQEGTDDPALRRSSFPADEAAVRHLNGRSQPSFEVEQHPR